jgi:hypothetical protein
MKLTLRSYQNQVDVSESGIEFWESQADNKTRNDIEMHRIIRDGKTGREAKTFPRYTEMIHIASSFLMAGNTKLETAQCMLRLVQFESDAVDVTEAAWRLIQNATPSAPQKEQTLAEIFDEGQENTARRMQEARGRHFK